MERDLAKIQLLRKSAIANGYALVRVKTASKQPVSSGWPGGEESHDLLNVTGASANTGILCRGLRVIDIDIDDEVVVRQVVGAIRSHLPPGAPIRRRPGSSRLALIYRAAKGEPTKRVLAGERGKIEVLGAGQQLVAFGSHPSGAPLCWHRDRSPATISLESLPRLSELEITVFLERCAAALGAPVTPLRHKSSTVPGGNRPTVTYEGNSAPHPNTGRAPEDVTWLGNLPPRPDLTAEAKKAAEDLGAGIEDGYWFSRLRPLIQEELVKACLSVIDNTKDDPRDRWLHILFAAADAERQGCPNARRLALEWSRRGAGWTSEIDFDHVWESAKPDGGITVATLLFHAQEYGFDLASFHAQSGDTDSEKTGEAKSNEPNGWQSKASSISEFFTIPPKRRFLFGTDIVRGAVSVVVAPGARGKTSLLTAMAISCACNRPFLQEPICGGPLGVLYINAEDPKAELWRRFHATMAHHNIPSSTCASLNILGAGDGTFAFLENDGGQPRLQKAAWEEFERYTIYYKPDVVFIDPLAAVFGGVSLNDNAAASLLMAEFTRTAARYNLAIVIAHHSAKGRDITSAEAAMGGAMTMNFARVGLSIDPMTVEQAMEFGIPECDAGQYFRLVGTKQNMSQANTVGRWHRLAQVNIANAEPPIYPIGDTVAVVERVNPTQAGFSRAMVQAVVSAIAAASPPLSPTTGRSGTDPIPVIETAMAPYMGRTSAAQAKALLKRLLASGNVQIGKCRVSRGTGHGCYERQALVVPQRTNATGNTP